LEESWKQCSLLKEDVKLFVKDSAWT